MPFGDRKGTEGKWKVCVHARESGLRRRGLTFHWDSEKGRGPPAVAAEKGDLVEGHEGFTSLWKSREG